MTKQEQLVLALKLGVINWYQYLEQYRKLSDD